MPLTTLIIIRLISRKTLILLYLFSVYIILLPGGSRIKPLVHRLKFSFNIK